MTNGSEKQIEWANKIKADFVETMGGDNEDLNYNLTALRRIGNRRIENGANTAEMIETVINVYEKAFENLKQNEDAIFWIDNRNGNYLELVSMEANKIDNRIGGERITAASYVFDRAKRNW